MIKKLIGGESKSITSAAIILALATLASKFLGLIRIRVLAGQFGAGYVSDAFYAAFRIPDLIFNIVVLGALSAGFIPVFAQMISQKKEDQAFRTANAIMNLLFLITLILCILAIIFAPLLIGFIAPGFDQKNKELTVQFTRIMFLSPIFLLLSSIIGGILQSYKRFFVYSLSPIMYNIGIITGAVFFTEWWGLQGLAWGVALGSFLHLAIQIPIAKKLGFSYKWILDIKDPGVIKMISLMVPRTITLIITQLNLTLVTIIASTLAIGSLTVFNFANDLQSFPLGLFAISYAIASFPTLSSLSGKEQRSDFTRCLTTTTKQILFFVIPMSILLIVLRAQIVRVILGWGKFTWEDTIMTLNALQIFSISLFAQALIPLYSRAFWALRDSISPFLSSLVGLAVNLILVFPLSKMFGVMGLVASFSIASTVNVVVLYFFLRKKIGYEYGTAIFKPILKITFAAVISGFFSHFFLYAIEPFLNTYTVAGIFIQGFFAGVVGLATYCLICSKLDIEEYYVFKNSIQHKLFKTKVITQEIVAEE